jgi:hypothetical protein
METTVESKSSRYGLRFLHPPNGRERDHLLGEEARIQIIPLDPLQQLLQSTITIPVGRDTDSQDIHQMVQNLWHTWVELLHKLRLMMASTTASGTTTILVFQELVLLKASRPDYTENLRCVLIIDNTEQGGNLESSKRTGADNDEIAHLGSRISGYSKVLQHAHRSQASTPTIVAIEGR